MDRRQQKTREAVYRAFNKLLETKRYEAITVQEIIDEANIGRSTFYAHFETKDELLRSMCTEIFNHVFAQSLSRESNHDYSAGNYDLEQKLGHILYHLRENKQKLKGILKSESSDLFMSYFKEYLSDMFKHSLHDFKLDVPADFLLHHLVGSFAEAVKWWIAEDTKHTPEAVAHYFMAVLQKESV